MKEMKMFFNHLLNQELSRLKYRIYSRFNQIFYHSVSRIVSLCLAASGLEFFT